MSTSWLEAAFKKRIQKIESVDYHTGIPYYDGNIIAQLIPGQQNKLLQGLVPPAVFFHQLLDLDIQVILAMEQVHPKASGMCSTILFSNAVKISINPKFVYKTDIVRTVAHEFVHVHQIQRGDLKRIDGIKYWKGQPYPDGDLLDRTLPWEVEANSLDSDMADMYRKQYYFTGGGS